MAEELKIYHINLNLAPVVDLKHPLNNNHIIGKGERSFSTDPDEVVKYASSFLQAHHDTGILTALKHFPGHGYAEADSHFGVVDITNTAKNIELVPFYQLIEKFPSSLVMTAHLINRNLDTHYPCTLSPKILQNLLRDKEFKGAVISDDLHMGAILNNFDLKETVIKAINAGCDILLFSNNPNTCKYVPSFQPDYNIPQKIMHIIKQAIKQKALSPLQIQQSYERINNTKRHILKHF